MPQRSLPVGRSGSLVGLVVLLGILPVACGGGGADAPTTPLPPPVPPPSVVASVSLDRASASMVPSDTTRFVATPRDASGNAMAGRTVTWSSSASLIASISSTGLVTALTPGTALITASSEGKSAQANITVVAPPVAAVVLDRTSDSLVVLDTTRLIATLRDAAGNQLTGRTVTWSSSASATASVSAEGVVSAVAPGSAEITATAEGISASATITVKARIVPVATVELSSDSLALRVAEQRTITATARATDGTTLVNRVISWSVANAAIASVTNGVVVAIAEGTTSVTASIEGVAATARVVVRPPPADVPILSLIVPASTIVGRTNVSVTLTGSNFRLGASVRWNGAPRPTSFVSDTMLMALLPASDLAALTIADITVANPGSDGGISAVRTFSVVPPSPTLTAALTAGTDFTCALAVTKLAYCWGGNLFSQLGNGVVPGRSRVPNAVINAPAFASLAASDPGACALTSAGATWCWGPISYATTNLPRLMPFAQPFAQIAVGAAHACGLLASGEAWCWGNNASGALGNGTLDGGAELTAVSGDHRFKQIALGVLHSCALSRAGEAWCWGRGTNGRLGTGSQVNSLVPAKVAGGHIFEKIAVGSAHACGVTAAGAAWCWGVNSDRQLGDGTVTARTAPVQVIGGRVFTSLALGEWQSCGLAASGEAWCWGRAVTLGSPATANSSEPVPVSGGHRFSSMAASGRSTCAVTSSDTAWCWGSSGFNTLGSGNGESAPSPVLVAGQHQFTTLAGGGALACALTRAGEAYCWGRGDDGQFGNGNFTYASRPSEVVGGALFTSISSGSLHSCGLTAQGAAWCWGYAEYGRLGNGLPNTRSSVQVQVAGGHTFTSLDAAEEHTCALTAAGEAWCWGEGESGRLGTGSTADRLVPTPVVGDLAFASVSGGLSHSCALTLAGAAYCWGGNGAGQLGTQDLVGSSAPRAVTGNHTFVSIAAGSYHACGIDRDGKAWCWGSNTDRALGSNQSVLFSPMPQPVAGAHVFASIYSGNNYSCALKANGEAWCWGNNASGQLGNGIRSIEPVPTRVQGGHLFTALALTRGFLSAHTCALKADGVAWCWGAGARGRLGSGSSGSYVPVQVQTIGSQLIWDAQRR